MKRLVFICLLMVSFLSSKAQYLFGSAPNYKTESAKIAIDYSDGLQRLMNPAPLSGIGVIQKIDFVRFEKNPIKNDFYVFIDPATYYLDWVTTPENEFTSSTAPVGSWGVYFAKDSLDSQKKDTVKFFDPPFFSKEDVEYFYMPFHISETEITNFHYQEFVWHVKDSLMREDLGYTKDDGKLDRDKAIPYDHTDWKRTSGLFEFKGDDPEDPSSYVIKKSKLKYTYFDDWDQTFKTVNILPDTNCWNADFLYSYNQPMVDYYFGHPAYHDYPVVGVSFDQAKAFCAWLTITLNNNPDYPKGLVADLPKPHQWFFAVNAEKKGFADLEQSYAGDQTFMADLLLKLPEGGNHMNELALNRVMNRQSKPTTYSHDGGFYTKPAYRNPKKETKENPLLIDEGPVMGLTDNVSEWIDFHYTEGYERILAQRQNYLRGSRNRANRFLADLEMYYDGHPGQALIYGANWFDERYSQLYGKNYAGAYAKAWSDPEMSYSTVGFRVVINYPVNQEVENN